jgi:hypothetical protein
MPFTQLAVFASAAWFHAVSAFDYEMLVASRGQNRRSGTRRIRLTDSVRIA